MFGYTPMLIVLKQMGVLTSRGKAMKDLVGNKTNRHYVPLNCSNCGRFVGRNGFPDVFYDDYCGGWECGYPLCERCLKKQGERRNDNEKEMC